MEDIENCALPSVSWAIPDGAWSDHGAAPGDYLGPEWVAAIVNSVGGHPQCPTGTPDAGEPFWNNTVIIVVWDDWGGFYDHVMPLNCLPNGTCTGYSNGTGTQYVYGFRVPMLVISAYNKHTTGGQQGFTGYISGALPPFGQGEVAPYMHDFGSILAFIEYNFGMVPIASPYYADSNAPDNQNGNVALADFFSLSNQRSFTNILTSYGSDKFRNYYHTLQNGVYPVPTGPDGTPGEQD